MSLGPPKEDIATLVDIPEDLPEDCGLSYDPVRTQLGSWSLSSLEKGAIEFLKDHRLHDQVSEGDVRHVGDSSATIFKLKDRVGQGGFGEVWEAKQSSLQRIVAVKRLRKDLLEDVKEEDRESTWRKLEKAFRQEALTTANLTHPNIVPVHELGVDEDGSPLMAMKFIRGKPWDEMIANDAGKMTPADFLGKHIPILVQMTQAVAFAHSRGVVHRDLKPSQVIVGEFGEVLLADWGLSVVFDEPLLLETEESLSAVFLPTPHSAPSPAGTPAFMAPEQTEKHSRLIGPWTDVYLLGGTLYFLLTFRRPHEAESSKEAFMKARLGDVFPPERAAANRRVPEELATLANRALEPDIEKRLQSASEFLEALQDYLSGSSKRRESRVLTDKAAEMLAVPKGDYRQFAEALSLIGQAVTLWGQNPHAEELKEKATRAFCLEALSNRDLVLARLQFDNLPEGQAKNRIRHRLDLAEYNSRRRDRQRRVAIALAGVLILIVISTSMFYNYQLDAERDLVVLERDEAQVARDSARVARDDAHQLVNFMTTDLLASLQGTPLLEPLRRVGDESIAYFESLRPVERTDMTDRQYAEALLTNGFVYKALGDSTKALDRFQRYLEVTNRLYSLDPENQKLMMDLAYGHVLIGMLMDERGNEEARHRGMAEAVALAAEYIARVSSVEMPAPMPAEELKRFATFLRETDDPNLLCSNPSATMNVAEAMIQWNGEDPQWVNYLTYLYTWTGEALLDDDSPGEAREMFERALNWRQKIAEEAPRVFDIEFSAFTDYRGLGQALKDLGDCEQAIDVYTEALEIAMSSGGNAGKNRRHSEAWQQGELIVRRSLAECYLELGEKDRAAEEAEKALNLAKVAVEQNDRNAQLKRQLFVTWHAMGSVHKSEEEYEVAREAYEEAIEIAAKLVRQDPLNTFWRSDAVELMRDYMDLAEVRQGNGETRVAAQMRDYARRVARSLPESSDEQGKSVRQALIEVCY